MTLTHGKNRRLIALASIMLAIGTALLIWGVVSLRSPAPSFSLQPSSLSIVPTVSTSAFAQPKNWPCPIPGDFKPVDIPVGLLCDYYEHGIEHAPPRDPSGVMQKRERFYAAPHDPFELLASAGDAGPLCAAFREALDDFRSKWLAGAPDDEDQIKSLEELAAQSSLRSDALIEAGRAMDWLGGDRAAAAFFTSGIGKAADEYAKAPAGSPAASPLLRAMDQTKTLWRLRAWPALEHRFRLANALRVPLSPEQRRAHYLVADMLYSQCKYDAAASEIERVMAEHGCAKDLGALEASDLPEMTWTLGLFQLAVRHPQEAVAPLDACSHYAGIHQADASKLAMLALVRANRLSDAGKRLAQFRGRLPHDAVMNAIQLELRARLERRGKNY